MVLSLPDDVPFVMRRDAWSVMTDAWESAAGGARRLVLVAGEAGSGKTRLVTEFARVVHDEGGVVLYGACAPAGVPYGPFREAFDGIGQQIRIGAREGQSERFAMWERVSDALQALAEPQPLLLVLDDLHWADAATADLLDDLARGAVPARTCIVAAFRTEPADVTPEARSVIAELRRRPGTSRLRIGGLDEDEIREFVVAAAGHRFHIGLEPVARFLLEQTDGNVFFAGELWRHLVESGRLVRPDERWRLAGPLDEVRTPPSVQQLVAVRLDALRTASREALEWAAVIGPTFDVELLARAVRTDAASVLAAIEPAIAAGIVVEQRPGTCRFSHSIVQQSARDNQPPAVRCQRHLGVAEALSIRPGVADRGGVALHLLAALPLGDRDAAVAAAHAAATNALGKGSYAEATRYGEAALVAVDDDAVRAQLLLTLAESHMRAGQITEAQSRALTAHELGLAAGDAEVVIASAIAYDEANWRAALHGGTSLRMLEAALALTDDEVLTVRLEAARGRALALSGHDDDAREICRRAMQRARQLDDPETTRLAYTALLFTAWTPDTVHELLDAARSFAEFAVGVGVREWELWALDKVLFGLITVGRLDEARRVVERHRAAAEQLGQPLFRVLDRQAHALLATGEGRFADAEALAAEANELGRFLSGRDATGGYGVQLFSIRREQGQLDEARPFVETLARLGEDGAAWQPALAMLYAACGMSGEASSVVARLAADELAGIARDSLRPAALAYLAEAACAVGDRRAAALVLAELAPHAGLVVQAGTFLAAYGAADRYLGMLCGLLDRRREAEAHFEAALRLETGARMPAWVARTQLEYGRVLATDPSAAEQASTLLRFATDTAERLGMHEVAAAARSLASSLAPTPNGRPAPIAGLTSRELGVLRLLVEGRSNRQIGEHLAISHHTAANHVRAILLKAGCSNRTEAAAWAVRNGLVDG